MQPFERTVVRRHAAVVQPRNSLHALLRHVLLGQNDRDLFRAVVAVVEEDHYVPFRNPSVAIRVHQRLHELIRVLVLLRVTVVAALHGGYHVGLLTTNAVHQLVISHFDALPTLVAVHRVETADDRSDMCAVSVAYFLQVGYKTLAAARVGVTTVHETVDESLLRHAVLFRDLHQFEQVVQRTMYAAGGAKTHDMQFLARCLRGFVCRNDLRVLHDRVVADGAVDLHQILIHHASGTDIQVSYLAVTHLSVRQTYILTTCLQLRMGVFG